MTRDELGTLASAVYGPQWQTQLARALGVNPRTVRGWASGRAAVPADRVEQIRHVLRSRAFDAIKALDALNTAPHVALADFGKR